MTASEGELFASEAEAIRNRAWMRQQCTNSFYACLFLAGFCVAIFGEQGNVPVFILGVLLMMAGSLLLIGALVPIPEKGLPDPNALGRRLGFVKGYSEEEVRDIFAYLFRLGLQVLVVFVAVAASVDYLVTHQSLPTWVHGVNIVTVVAGAIAFQRRLTRRRIVRRS